MGRTKETRRPKAKTAKAQVTKKEPLRERPTLFSLAKQVASLDVDFLNAYLAVVGTESTPLLTLNPIASFYQAKIKSCVGDFSWINNVTDEELKQFKTILDGFHDKLHRWADEWKVKL